MKLLHVLQALWCEPWLILPEMHRQLCDIVEAHMDGSAHVPGGIAGIFDDKKDDDNAGLKIVDDYAIVSINGTIGKRVSRIMKSSGITDVDDISRNMTRANESSVVRGILLDVNSPGGTVTGVPELAEEIAEISRNKPVVAFTDQLMASAAYWISSGATAIYSTPSALVGSIGVYMAWLDVSRSYDDFGWKTELVKHGKFKAMGLSGTSINKEQRAHLQAEVDKIYDWFAGAITEKRDIPADAMEGQTFKGRDAVNVNIVDAVGSVEDAIAELKDLMELNFDG